MQNAQRFLDPHTGPPGGWRYLDKDTGYTVKALTLAQLLRDAKTHRTSNGLTIPDDFDQQVETWLCRLMPPGLCIYLDGRGLGGSLCVHRGDFIRYVKCDTCGGTIKGKVLACAVHEECTTFTKEIGVKQCATCPDRLEPE